MVMNVPLGFPSQPTPQAEMKILCSLTLTTNVSRNFYLTLSVLRFLFSLKI